jgi:hypothetical protein
MAHLAAVGDLVAGARAARAPHPVRAETHFLSHPRYVQPRELRWRHRGLAAVAADGAAGVVLADEPGVASDSDQLELARRRAGASQEGSLRYLTFRSTATPSATDHHVRGGRALAAVLASGVAEGAKTRRPPSESLQLPEYTVAVNAVGVTLYANGRRGCLVAFHGEVERLVDQAFGSALRALRAALGRRPWPIDAAAVCVLGPPQVYADVAAAELMDAFRLGVDSVAVAGGRRFAIMLPTASSCVSTREAFLRAVAVKAGTGAAQAATWAVYPTWAARHQDGSCCTSAVGGYRTRRPAANAGRHLRCDVQRIAAQLAGYIHRARAGELELPAYWRDPASGRRRVQGSVARRLHALAALAEAAAWLSRPDMRLSARQAAQRCFGALEWQDGSPSLVVDGETADDAAFADLLRCAARVDHRSAVADRVAKHLIATLTNATSPPRAAHGHARTDEFLSGSAIHAVALWARHQPARESIASTLGRLLDRYAERSLTCPTWGAVFWLPVAADAVCSLDQRWRPSSAWALLDWAMRHQLSSTGAFLTNLPPRKASFHTACVGEALVAGASLALCAEQPQRATTYMRRWAHAMRFMETLVVDWRDTYSFADPGVTGGVRLCPLSSEIRIDFVSHALLSFVRGARLLDESAAMLRRPWPARWACQG